MKMVTAFSCCLVIGSLALNIQSGAGLCEVRSSPGPGLVPADHDGDGAEIHCTDITNPDQLELPGNRY